MDESDSKSLLSKWLNKPFSLPLFDSIGNQVGEIERWS
mgnify:CR=1 FL=1